MTGQAQAIIDLSNEIKPLLAGRGDEVQGGVLADLVAIYLAGHVILGDKAETEKVREALLKVHIDTVRSLIAVNCHILGVEVTHESKH